MASEVGEEVILDREVVAAEHFAPGAGEFFLQRGLRGHAALSEPAAEPGETGAGKRARSALPLGSMGMASRISMNAGTM